MSVNSVSEQKAVVQKAMKPGWFIDSDSPSIQQFAEQNCGDKRDALSMSVALYNAVRDQVLYDPYSIQLEPETFRASEVLQSGRGFCVAKAVLYAAVLRAAGIPSRVGFADVRNHLTTPQLRELMGTDVFYYHGYSEVWLNGRWLKATPAFNLSLCEKFGTLPLEFDGTEDSIFHPFDRSGQKHMEYINDHGPHLDLPYDEMMAVYRRRYPVMFGENTEALAGNFEEEAQAAETSA